MFFNSKKTIAELSIKIDKLNRILVSKENDIYSLSQKLKEVTQCDKEHYKKLELENENLKTQLKERKKIIDEFNNEINRLNKSLVSKENDICSLSQKLKEVISKSEQEQKKTTSQLQSNEERYKRIELENEDFKIQLKERKNFISDFVEKLHSIEVESVQTVRYNVKYQKYNESDSREYPEYTLSADIDISKINMLKFKNSKIFADKIKTVLYSVSRIYYNKGGYIHFDKSHPIVSFNQKISAEDDNGQKCYITLTEEKTNTLVKEMQDIRTRKRNCDDFVKDSMKKLEKIISSEEEMLPYFSSLFADYRYYLNKKYVQMFLEKKPPARKAAEKLKEVNNTLRYTEKKLKNIQYKLDAYEYAVPWLSDFDDITKQEIEDIHEAYTMENKGDQEYFMLKEYISPTEYKRLSDADRYQLALNRYWKKRKSNWQIGIAYERYVGYLYELKNYHVTYFGAVKGMDDLGRDIIAKNENETLIIQCKYWNTHKTIHEKHVFQLYGTMIAYSAERDNNIDQIKFSEIGLIPPDIKGLLITTCQLSDKAKFYAKCLNIEIKENFDFDKDYPCIKCNISRSNGEKIYHLPFDQQYDNIVIEYDKGEFYAQTTKEAEEHGFRRAFRWHSK